MAAGRQYEFGHFCLDSGERELFRNGERIPLTPKAVDALLILVERHEHTVRKDELMEKVWPGTFVSESSLSQVIWMLRKTLGDTADSQEIIATVPKRGYRFVAAVRLTAGDEIVSPAVVGLPPATRAADATPSRAPIRSFRWAAAVGLSFTAVTILGAYLYLHRRPVLTEKDSVVLTDFGNTTGDNVFDETLRQALAVQLEQSPFLNVLSRARVSEQLKLMRRAPDERITEPLARDLCQRSGSAALISGSISKLGNHYVIGLNVLNCRTGDSVASEQAVAESREKVLNALSEASGKIRARLGESLASIRQYDTPVEQATTNSLDALKAYSKAVRTPPGPAVVPLLKLAIDLDPSFAAAYSVLGVVYTDLGEYQAASECYQKAFELRDRLTEREKLHAVADYYSGVIGDLDKANETYEIWQQAFPRDAVAHNDLAYNLELAGQYDRELSEAQLANRLDPSLPAAYVHLMYAYSALNRLDEAMGAYQEAERRHLDDYPDTHYMMYQLASARGDAREMEHQLAWSKGRSEVEGWMLSFQADAEAFSGHLEHARELSAGAAESVGRAGQYESATLIELNRAWRDAVFGFFRLAREETKIATREKQVRSRDVQALAALILARAGDISAAQAIATDLETRFADNTLLKGYWLPSLRALVALNKRNPAKALEDLQVAKRYELGVPQPSFEEAAPFLPVYFRGEAYLLLNQGKQAAAEFQKLIAYRGVTTNGPLAALAHLQLGRVYAQQGDTSRALSEYQAFLALWKDADPDIPVLREAKIEFAKLH